ncbi:MAG TPA: bL21 family ribosomal protein, partial [Spirochaetales bacterium]|nr:bL21 family ribosomal protein [Spirochaetales bacterium]
MYAIVDVKGKQYKVEQDKLIKVDKIDAEPGANLEFDTVMLFSDQE